MRLFTLLAFILISLSGYSQKQNMETARALCDGGKFQEAYTMLKSDKFKYKEEEKDAYKLLLAYTCYSLYVATPEINSDYRNEGINHAAEVEGTSKKSAEEVITYLTTSIYQDMLPVMKEASDSSTLIFKDFTPLTLLAFKHFILPAEWTPDHISSVASHFYHDAAYISNLPDINSDTFDGNLRMHYYACKKIAAKFYGVLCTNHQRDCELYNIVK